jgi:methyl-accepting chemotaxis protein
MSKAGGIAQVGEAIAQLDRVTQRNAGLVQEEAAAAQSLSEEASELTNAVAIFRLSEKAEREAA